MTEVRPRLTRDAVLKAALATIDQGGLEGCTMRAVGAELGVEAMSLYWHVPSKEALLDGVVELMLRETEQGHAVHADWMLSLADFARTFRRVVLRHRNALPLLASRPLGAYIAAGRMTETGIRNLEEAGFDRTTAIRAARTVTRYVIGFTLAERTDPPATPTASASPALDELLTAVAEDDPEELFTFGLDALLRGFATHLGANGARRPRPA